MRAKDIDKAMETARAKGNRVRVWTNVSGKRVEVEIGMAVNYSRSSYGRRVRRYYVDRVDNGMQLPKARTAASLHCSDGSKAERPSMTETQDRPVATVSADLAAAFGMKEVPGHLSIEGRPAKVTPQVKALDGMAPLGVDRAAPKSGAPKCTLCGATGTGALFSMFSKRGFGSYCVPCENVLDAS